MRYYSNHVYCTKSHRGGSYRSRHMVSIEEYLGDTDDIDPDWLTLIQMDDVVDTEKQARDALRGFNFPSEDYVTSCPSLKPEVIAWINENIKPPNSPVDLKNDQWGWAMGNDSYRIGASINLNLWFYRRSDAMAFIRKWSVHKKPTSYFNYFSGYRWTLGADGKIIKG